MRLVEHVERLAGSTAAQLGGQLYALSFAAGQRRRRLAQLDIAQTHVYQRLQFCAQSRQIAEKLERSFSGHVEHFVYVLALIAHLERLAVVAVAAADVARHIYVGQKVHLNFDYAVARAGFAPAALYVEREAVALVTARLGVGCGGEHIAYQVKQAGVRGRVGARRAAYRRLVYGDYLVELIQAVYAVVGAGAGVSAIEVAGERFV